MAMMERDIDGSGVIERKLLFIFGQVGNFFFASALLNDKFEGETSSGDLYLVISCKTFPEGLLLSVSRVTSGEKKSRERVSSMGLWAWCLSPKFSLIEDCCG